jgi:antitoxin HigA-1
MSIPNKRARKVRPTHPGVMLREDFLPEYGLTVSGFARSLRVSRQTVNDLLRERRAISPEMALRLSRLFGNSPEFWLNAQRAVDLWEAARNLKAQINHMRTGLYPATAIDPHKATASFSTSFRTRRRSPRSDATSTDRFSNRSRSIIKTA